MVEEKKWRNESWVGLGAFLLAAVYTVGSAVWPDNIRPHPYWVISIGVVGLCFIVFGGIRAIRSFWRDRNNKVDKFLPLEIIFEPLNPARRFWSLESHVDAYKRLIGNFWEHRVEVKNNSMVTLRNVIVTVEKIGPMPVKLQRASFIRTGMDSCDINPGCSELVLVNRHPHPKRQVGMPAGDTAWVYGPIRVIASADNTLPTEVIYDFHYDTEQMLFERGKY